MRRKWRFLGAVPIIVMGLTVGGPAQPASASQPCSPFPNPPGGGIPCFGYAQWIGQFEGITGNVRANCMGLVNSTRIVRNYLEIRDNGNYVQAGLYRGTGNLVSFNPVPYVIESGDPGYFEIDQTTQTIPYGTGINVSIVESTNGSGNWNVSYAGNSYIAVPNLIGPADYGTAGMTTDDNANLNTGFVQALTYYNSVRVHVSGWSGATVTYSGPSNGGTSWNDPSTKVRVNYRIGTAC